MSGFFGGAQHLTLKLRTRVVSWARRLRPSNPKDAWRGSMPHSRGLQRIPYLSVPSSYVCIVRSSKPTPAGMRYTYALYVRWRTDWRILIPISPNPITQATLGPSTAGTIAQPLQPSLAQYLERVTLTKLNSN